MYGSSKAINLMASMLEAGIPLIVDMLILLLHPATKQSFIYRGGSRLSLEGGLQFAEKLKKKKKGHSNNGLV